MLFYLRFFYDFFLFHVQLQGGDKMTKFDIIEREIRFDHNMNFPKFFYILFEFVFHAFLERNQE